MMISASSISVSFGGVRAVQDASIDVGATELVGLVGPNGSGKTTLLNAICGVVAAHGELRVAGEAVGLGSARRAGRAGIGRVFQAPQCFTALTCTENVLLSSVDTSARGLTGSVLRRQWMWRHERSRWARAEESLEIVGLKGFASVEASQLTYGQQRLLELARSLAGTPKVLLLDEPSAGLNDSETASLQRLLLHVRSAGIPLLVIDHKVDFIDALCDRVVVMELGRVIASGPPHEVWRDPLVVAAYLGVGSSADD